MKFYKVGLTKKEVTQGKKKAITEAVCQEYRRCAVEARDNKFFPEDKKQAEIFFENDFTNENFEKQYANEQDILYINEVAKKILDKNHITMRVYGEVLELPKRIGLVQSISVYSK